MPIQVAFAYNASSEAELKELGFVKQEVYVKETGSKKEGDAEFFCMKAKPYQFITTDYWGACPD